MRGRLRRPVFFGTMRRTTPLSAHWGFDRGTPVDRFFVERFLEHHSRDITGRVLEVGDDRYTRRFGREVAASDVLDVDPRPGVTVVGDLGVPETLPEARYDCVILTQTLQYVFDLEAGIASVARLLAPAGVVLATLPTLGRMDETGGIERDFWRFTPTSARRLFEAVFDGTVEVEAHGNVLLASAFLFGLAAEELKGRELEENDPLFPLIVSIRARR